MKTLGMSGTVLLLFSFLLHSSSLPAQEVSSTALCSSGAELLLKGRQMNSAIAKFSVLTKREPDNAYYHLMLGDAYASRLASLACAVEGSTYEYGSRKIYETRLRIWQQMQDDPNMPLFGTSKPVEPPLAQTPDDGKRYAIVGTTAKGEKPDPTNGERQALTELAENALCNYTRARKLSRAFPAKSKTKIGYECGWGMLMLYRYGKEYLKFETNEVKAKPTKTESLSPPQSEPLPDEKPVLKQAEIIACFQECVEYDKDDPKKIVYDKKKAEDWQSLAFAHAPDYLLDVVHSTDFEKMIADKRNHVKQAVSCLRRALALKRDDNQVLYQIACVSALALPQEAAKSLAQLHAQSPNAVYCYLLAESQFNQAEELKGDDAVRMNETALASVEAGNCTLNYQAIPLNLPIPKSLLKAWNYRALYGIGEDMRCLQFLFRYCAEISKETVTDEKQNQFQMRLGGVIMELGLHALRQYQGDDLDPADFRTQIMLYSRAFYGMLCCGKSSRIIKEAKKKMPNAENTLIAEKYEQYEDYWKAWDKALTGQ